MRKFYLLILNIFLPVYVFAVNYRITGLESGGGWYYVQWLSGFFAAESSMGFVEHTVTAEYKMVPDSWGNGPSSQNQPFEIIFTFDFPQDITVTNAAVLLGDEWIEAIPEEVLAAEEIYNLSKKEKPSLLLRERVERKYDGQWYRKFELRIAPIYYLKPFSFRLTYFEKAEPDINALRTKFQTYQFGILNTEDRDRKASIQFYFKDFQFPDSKPQFYDQMSSFKWQENPLSGIGGYTTTISVYDLTRRGSYYLYCSWSRPFSWQPEIWVDTNSGNTFYNMITNVPLKPENRQARKVLLLYDLGPFSVKNKNVVFENLKNIAAIGLVDTDSINVLYIDTQFNIVSMFSEFEAATKTLINSLFSHFAERIAPQMSGLPQLLRVAKDYFNRAKTDGEIWIVSDANKHCDDASSANKIIELSLDQMMTNVRIYIFDCSYPYANNASRLYVNGRYYPGNEYLYENLSRKSNGGFLCCNTINNDYDILRELSYLFVPAVDMLEIDYSPDGGYCASRYQMNENRSHFPITFPYHEIGRMNGSFPIETTFYGNVLGDYWQYNSSIQKEQQTTRTDLIRLKWHSLHIRDMLQEPQSYAAIEKIGALSKEINILSPYCSFVVPSASGYKGFERWIEEDHPKNEDQFCEVAKPDEYKLTAFPNPFNTTTTIKFSFSFENGPKEISIIITDILGRKVKEKTLQISELSSITWTWDGTDNNLFPLGTGLYFVRCQADKYTKTIKITLLK